MTASTLSFRIWLRYAKRYMVVTPVPLASVTVCEGLRARTVSRLHEIKTIDVAQRRYRCLLVPALSVKAPG